MDLACLVVVGVERLRRIHNCHNYHFNQARQYDSGLLDCRQSLSQVDTTY